MGITMNNEPVAWMQTWENQDGELKHTVNIEQIGKNDIPLYTHPAKELNAGGEPVKNATYWKRQYNEMSALNDRLKSSLYHANEQIKYLESHPAKTLTDEEIEDALYVADITLNNLSDGDISMERIKAFVRTVLKKAQEKL